MRENGMFEHHPTTHSPSNASTPTTTSVDRPRAPPTPRIDSRRLMAGENELVIEHAGQEYRLRLTRNDKLILTK
jgi:hemin uptake protein HemP